MNALERKETEKIISDLVVDHAMMYLRIHNIPIYTVFGDRNERTIVIMGKNVYHIITDVYFLNDNTMLLSIKTGNILSAISKSKIELSDPQMIDKISSKLHEYISELVKTIQM